MFYHAQELFLLEGENADCLLNDAIQQEFVVMFKEPSCCRVYTDFQCKCVYSTCGFSKLLCNKASPLLFSTASDFI